MTFQSSSEAAMVYYLYPTLKTLLGYESMGKAYADRSNHRALWYELIKAINFREPTTLGRKIFEGKDVYCGIRNIAEFEGLKYDSCFDLSIWVDASERHPPEDDKSCTVTADDMDIILDNNGTLEELKVHIAHIMKLLTKED
jgi:hypothetical protein